MISVYLLNNEAIDDLVDIYEKTGQVRVNVLEDLIIDVADIFE